MTTTPRLSIIVIAYDMAEQALRTLQSLSPAYQEGVRPEDYEVILVENRSARCMDAAAVAALPGQVRYTLRDNDSVSPARAINLALSQARGEMVGIMIDGARMVTPGVIRHVLMARDMNPMAVVAVPGYQLGPHPQHMAETRLPAEDTAALAAIDWPSEGYRLFEIASMSQANRGGFFGAFMECNCLFAPASVLRELGGADERFDLPGGGALNLHLYGQLVNHPATELFYLIGEGSFHQAHGGVTTTRREDREALLTAIRLQLEAINGGPFAAPAANPVLLGRLHPAIHPFLSYSAERFAARATRSPALRAALGEAPLPPNMAT